MNKKRWIGRIAALFVLSVIAVGIAVPSLAMGDYDLSKPSSPYNKEILADELLDMQGISISDVEREYLKEYPSLTLRYDDTVTTANITTELAGTTLRVVAKPYTYTSQSGESVVWIPTAARFGDKESGFTEGDGGYVAHFADVSEEDSASILLNVDYSLDIEIAKDDFNALLNQAYNDAAIWREYGEYLAKMEVYRAEYAEYSDYLALKYAYDDALTEYNRYLAQLEAYHAAVENNNNYDNAMLEYNRQLLLYREYRDKLEDYEAELSEYAAYLERCKRLQDQLSAIEAAGLAMTDGRVVYASIMGGTVTEVLENKHLFTASGIGADPALIDSAGIATEALRVLLPEYFGYETFEERYTYYITNYEAFRDNFALLLKSLDGLYRSGKVREVLIMEEKDRKYIILVAQLAHIANALCDTDIISYYGQYTYDENFKIEGQTVAEILEHKSYLVDTGNAYPDPEGYPLPMDEPVAPTVVDEPEKPEKVEIPIYPDEVDNPGDAPTIVYEPEIPTTVLPPRGEESPAELPRVVVALIEAYDKGDLAQRDGYGEPITVHLTKTVEKKVFGAEQHTVFFYNESGDEILFTTTVDDQTLAAFEGKLPERAPTRELVYSFDAWVNSDGDAVDLESVTGDLILYPTFVSAARPYPITFNVDGVKITESFPYGSIPAPDFTPTRADEGSFCYIFSGWEGGLLPVSSEAEYTATFDKVYILPTSVGGATITISDGFYVADTSASNDITFDLSRLLKRVTASEGGGLSLVTKFGKVNLSYTTATRILEDGNTDITIYLSSLPYGRSYAVSLMDPLGVAAPGKYTMTAYMPYHTLLTDSARLGYTADDGSRSYVQHALKDGYVEFVMTSGVVYTYATERAINVLSSENITLSLSHLTARPGENVYVSYTLFEGIKLDRLYMIGSDGAETQIRAGTFVMPNDDVTVYAKTSLAKYKVVFKDGDKVISSHSYTHGAEIVLPSNPSKVNDTTYSYTFIGWADADGNIVEIDGAAAEATYYAMYERELLPERPKEGLMISDRFLKPIATAAALGAVLLLSVIPSGVLALVFRARLKRTKKRR